jgi:hypothetical protein
VKYKEPSANTVSPCPQLMKATVLAESSILYFIFSPGSLHYSDVYRCESGRCRTLPFFLIIFIISLYINSAYPSMNTSTPSSGVSISPSSSSDSTLGGSGLDGGVKNSSASSSSVKHKNRSFHQV